MEKYLKYLLFISLTIILWGCGGDDEPENNAGGEYYVKYEATVSSRYIGKVNYRVATENGIQEFKSSKSFSQTFGPFKKGFNAAITADASHFYQAECNVRIYVAKGTEPFALKANSSSSGTATATYIIGR